MRKIHDEILTSFLCLQPLKRGYVETDGHTVWYRGNAIAEARLDDGLYISMAGWDTVTTRSWLNSLLTLLDYPGRISRDEGVTYFYIPAGPMEIDPDKFYCVLTY
jgi:hypothetical protein